ncbi:hypothetical protein Acr_00g0067380 [Actinidia rufa]|uniref:Reverse transcriptase zinc-binding domain-containing protein n=1 Tax=Actinidia rufa TaxID=165716 RepID=A0A7J0DQW7_9ERIC|nr:hypothetical protein Acr_00g0067380 [Actinidia rufa]
MHQNGTDMYRFCKKLKAVKDPLKELNRKQFSHIAARAEAAEEELKRAQHQLHASPEDHELQVAIPVLRANAVRLAEAELSYCSQLAKAKYLKNSDKGTKFFHDLIKSNRSKNHIASISLGEGGRSTSSKQVSEAFIHFYKDLLGSKENCIKLNRETVLRGKLLEAEQANLLLREVTEEEIKAALFSIGESKAPGPDGFTSCFYKKAWNVIGRDFLKAVKEFFDSGRILKGLGQLKSNADFNFHPKCGGLKITHLAFVDDLMLLSRGDPISVALLMENLKHFGDCSGRKISLTKSSLFTAGINSQDLDSIMQISGFSQGTFPFRYLGIPVADSRLKISQYGPLIDKINGYISAWAGGQNLSYAGRAELVKSVRSGSGMLLANYSPHPSWAYDYFRPRRAKLAWTKMVWQSFITPKHSIILWLGLKEKLLTKDKLQGVIEDMSCPLCRVEDETIDHLFFCCRIANEVWARINSWLGITKRMQTLKAAVKWMIKEARGTGVPAKIKRLTLASTIYHIWEAKNQRNFEGKIRQPKAIVRRIQIQVYRCMYSLYPDVMGFI